MKKLLLICLMTTSLNAGVFGPSRGKINAIKDRADSAQQKANAVQQEAELLKEQLHTKEIELQRIAAEVEMRAAETVTLMTRMDHLEERSTAMMDKIESNTQLILVGLKEAHTKADAALTQVNKTVNVLGEHAHLLYDFYGKFSEKLEVLTAVVNRLLGAENELDSTLTV